LGDQAGMMDGQVERDDSAAAPAYECGGRCLQLPQQRRSVLAVAPEAGERHLARARMASAVVRDDAVVLGELVPGAPQMSALAAKPSWIMRIGGPLPRSSK
jgi:hypothetical protein